MVSDVISFVRIRHQHTIRLQYVGQYECRDNDDDDDDGGGGGGGGGVVDDDECFNILHGCVKR